MEERLAFVAESINEAKILLEKFLAQENLKELHRGSITSSDGILVKHLISQQRFEQLLGEQHYEDIAKFWAKGQSINWNRMYEPGEMPRRMSLPGYPFSNTQLENDLIDVSRSKIIKDTDNNYSTLDIKEKALVFIRNSVSRLLNRTLDKVPPYVGFIEIGLTSIDIITMTQLFKNKIDVQFSPDAFFECHTIEALSNYLAIHYPLQMEKLDLTKNDSFVLNSHNKKNSKALKTDNKNLNFEQNEKPDDLLNALEALEEGKIHLNDLVFKIDAGLI
jgi:acyl transferase domain-containing protein